MEHKNYACPHSANSHPELNTLQAECLKELEQKIPQRRTISPGRFDEKSNTEMAINE